VSYNSKSTDVFDKFQQLVGPGPQIETLICPFESIKIDHSIFATTVSPSGLFATEKGELGQKSNFCATGLWAICFGGELLARYR
jgi:hypothetical protein